jgi:acyl carrier protein
MKTQTREEAFNFIKETCDGLGFDIENITEETEISQTMDSLDVVELCMQLEKTSNKSITDSSVERWETFKDVVDTYLIVCSDE